MFGITDPRNWGNGSWFAIFVIIFKYYDDVEKMKKILNYLCRSLPCPTCRNHIIDNIQRNNIMSTSSSLRVLNFFIAVRNAFQQLKQTDLTDKFIIPQITNPILTKKTVCLVLSKFCYEFTCKNNDIDVKNEFSKIEQLLLHYLNNDV